MIQLPTLRTMWNSAGIAAAILSAADDMVLLVMIVFRVSTRGGDSDQIVIDSTELRDVFHVSVPYCDSTA